jgi:hypothetical protein
MDRLLAEFGYRTDAVHLGIEQHVETLLGGVLFCVLPSRNANNSRTNVFNSSIMLKQSNEICETETKKCSFSSMVKSVKKCHDYVESSDKNDCFKHIYRFIHSKSVLNE